MSACCFSTVSVYLDIENTVIDDLTKGNFLEDNCKRIAKLIHSIAYPVKVHLYTWGWKYSSEVEEEVVKRIFNKLEINAFNRGTVYTKAFSVDKAIQRGLLSKDDREKALIPGMMKSFHIDKIMCFYSDFSNYDSNHAILIDDLVEKTEANPYDNVSLVNLSNIPDTLDSLLTYIPESKVRSPIMTEERARSESLKWHALNGGYIAAFRAINRIVNVIRYVISTSGTELITDMRVFESSSITMNEVPIYERLWNILFGDFDKALEIYNTCYIEDGNSKLSFTQNTKELIRKTILEDIERNPLEWANVPDIGNLAQHYINSASK